MNIPPVILLILGISAGILFIIVFITAWIVVFRNREIINKERKR